MEHYDAIIIGAGQAGVPLAKKLAELGKKTALIEKRFVGATCVNDGCTPTKAIVASAKAAHDARHAAALGIDVQNVTVDLKKIKARKDEIVKSFRNVSQKGIEETKNLTLIFGEARFTAEKTVVVKDSDGEKTYTAELIFINTGATVSIPDIAGLDAVDYLTSTTILDLEQVPEKLLVIGGNYIGLEFGQMFSRFGSKVTVLERSSRIMGREDEDVSAEMSAILKEEGVDILTDTQIIKKDKNEDKVTVHYQVGENKHQISGSHVLIATGRIPQTKHLGLEAAGVETDDKNYIVVNDTLETNIAGIYALGDVKGGPAFTHIAYNDYTIVYRNLFENKNFSIADRSVPYCMFTDPQLGRIGVSEAEAKKKGLNYKVVKLPMSQVARGIETGETLGFMKAIVDVDSKKIIGVAILSSIGGELMSVLQMAMDGGITYDQIRYGVYAHPTYSESFNNLFMKLDE